MGPARFRCATLLCPTYVLNHFILYLNKSSVHVVICGPDWIGSIQFAVVAASQEYRCSRFIIESIGKFFIG